MQHTATYSPEDDKIRIYPAYRLDKETEYAQVKAAGFQWAPQQKLFYATWTPGREDLAIELCGDIDDEDRTLAERADDRAERFDGYQENRRKDAKQASDAVSALADGIPLGQPILIGHHSEKRARRDAEKIKDGMRRAIKMWDTAEYWKSRAAGALAHAKYKELPRVRARRIKTLEADQRRSQRTAADCARSLGAWSTVHDAAISRVRHHDGSPSTFQERAAYLANATMNHRLYTDITAGTITPEECQTRALSSITATKDHADRWIAHLEHRIGYERALLDEQGESHRLEKPKRRALAPLLNYRVAEGLIIENRWNRGSMITYPLHEMTKAEYAAIHDDYKGTRPIDGHRVRTAMLPGSKLVYVFLTDAGTHPRPATIAPPAPEPEPDNDPLPSGPKPTPPADVYTREEFERDQFGATGDAIAGMRASLRAGIKTTSAPQLFPTPVDLARQVIELADIRPGMRILEPSAGTGRLIQAIAVHTDWKGTEPIEAIEMSFTLATALQAQYKTDYVRVTSGNFLDITPEQIGTFDRIVANPPFTHGADIEHIEHMRKFLRPGGRLVSICAAGPKQTDAYRDVADEWIDLPAGSFASEGTNVSTAIVVFDVAPDVRAGSGPADPPAETPTPGRLF